MLIFLLGNTTFTGSAICSFSKQKLDEEFYRISDICFKHQGTIKINGEDFKVTRPNGKSCVNSQVILFDFQILDIKIRCFKKLFYCNNFYSASIEPL